MVSKELVLTNAQGFHMRPASVFATAMGKYSCDVTIKFNGNQYNAKSSSTLLRLASSAAVKLKSFATVLTKTRHLQRQYSSLRAVLANNGTNRPVTRGEDYATRNSRIRGYRNR